MKPNQFRLLLNSVEFFLRLEHSQHEKMVFVFLLFFLQPEGSESPLVVRFNRLARPYLNRDNFAYGPSTLWMAYGH